MKLKSTGLLILMSLLFFNLKILHQIIHHIITLANDFIVIIVKFIEKSDFSSRNMLRNNIGFSGNEFCFREEFYE